MSERTLLMTEADIYRIVEIERACFTAPWRRQSFIEELNNPYSLSIVMKKFDSLENSHIHAYSCNHIVGTELTILRMAVIQEKRRLGLGHRLLGIVLRQAGEKGATEAFLEVRPSNEQAVNLYRKLGFELIGRRPNYYSETGEDALVMMKNLKEIL